MPDLQLTDVDDCTILIETGHAYLVLTEGRRSGTFTMPIWLAKEKELV